jgi:hypothetical protein
MRARRQAWLALFIWLAGNAASAQVSPEARIALDTLGTPRTLKADFIQEKTLVGATRPIIAKGRLVYSAELGVAWTLREPIQHTLVLPAKATQGTNRALNESAAIVGSIVAGNPESLARHFAIEATKDTGGWDIRLRPSSQGLARIFSEITLRVESKVVTRVVMRETRGDGVTIRLVDPIVDQPLSPEENQAFGSPSRTK